MLSTEGVPELENDITQEEIKLAIAKLKTGKSPGIDGLPPTVICGNNLILII